MNRFKEKYPLVFSGQIKGFLILIFLFGAFSIISGQIDLTFHLSTQSNKCLHCVCSSQGSSYVGGDSGTVLLESYNNFWAKQQTGTSNDLLGILEEGNGQIVAVGEAGTIILGGSWHDQVSNTVKTLRAIAFGGGLFVAVGDSGLILTSPNDTTWTNQISGTTKCLRSVGHPGGYFTAVGDSGTILTSLDGIVWTNQTSGTIKNLNAVSSGNLFGGGSIRGIKTVAIGDSGIILTSSDSGKTWNSQTSGTTNTLWGIFCLGDDLNGHWLFYITVGAQGTILTSYTNVTSPSYSLPGVVWTPQMSGTTRNLYGVSWGYQDSIVAVGDSGTILTSYYQPPYTEIKQGKIATKPKGVSVSNGIFFYSLSESSRMSIMLYDIKGRLVKTLINRIQRSGTYSVAMPNDISPGTYIAAIISGNQKLDRTIFFSRQ
jgi:hypothetical protein